MGWTMVNEVRSPYWADKVTVHQRFILEGMALGAFDPNSRNVKSGKPVCVYTGGTAALAASLYGTDDAEACDKINEHLKALKRAGAIELVREAGGRHNRAHYLVRSNPDAHQRFIVSSASTPSGGSPSPVDVTPPAHAAAGAAAARAALRAQRASPPG